MEGSLQDKRSNMNVRQLLILAQFQFSKRANEGVLQSQNNYPVVHNPPGSQYFNPHFLHGPQQPAFLHPANPNSPGQPPIAMGPSLQANRQASPYQGQPFGYPPPIRMPHHQPGGPPLDPVLQDILDKIKSLRLAVEGIRSVQKDSVASAATDNVRIAKLEGFVGNLNMTDDRTRISELESEVAILRAEIDALRPILTPTPLDSDPPNITRGRELSVELGPENDVKKGELEPENHGIKRELQVEPENRRKKTQSEPVNRGKKRQLEPENNGKKGNSTSTKRYGMRSNSNDNGHAQKKAERQKSG
ncbi:hypothetical protein HYALB_00010779 [Hymenoscyphus albidus]|uniref:Uncharacterized protein n=1 Tax=Hymenoscyphus albidus TaxID=595503 RepID=A0A9N9LTH3_9HELO|nr:hypothetical protein HYALB_00010779 [Hymenoscyphus albidus]